MKRFHIAVLFAACLALLAMSGSALAAAPAQLDLVKRLNPNSADSEPTPLAQVGNELFFFADDGTTGNELWKTDGTSAGTTLVKDINPGRGDSRDTGVGGYAVAGGKLYFVASAGTTPEVWVSDGTPEGTTPVTSFGSSDEPYGLTAVGGKVLFFGTSADEGTELWSTNGTSAATLVKDIDPGSAGSDPSFQPVIVSGEMYFTADDGTGSAIWKTDGTENGTVMAVNSSSDAGALRAVGADLFWVENGHDLYSGTSSETLVHSFSKSIQELTAVTATNGDSTLYLTLVGTPENRQLWKVGENDLDATLVTTLSSGLNGLRAGAGLLFFNQHVGDRDVLHVSDGTSGGTISVDPTQDGVIADNQFGTSSALYFSGFGPDGNEPYVSDGTPSGTTLLKDVNPGTQNGSDPRGFTKFDGDVYFYANDTTHGAELWKTDGTENGTALVKDINAAGAGSSPFQLTDFDGTLYFAADNLDGLFRSDGTDAGTSEVGPGTVRGPSGLVHAGGNLFFTAYTDAKGTELWRKSASGDPTMVADILNGAGGSYPQDLTAVGNEVYFFADEGFGDGNVLWVSDGTTTQKVTGLDSQEISDLTAFDGKLLFHLAAPDREELWEATGASATKVHSFDAAAAQTSQPQRLTAVGDKLFFLSFDGNGPHLGVSDGSDSGTKSLLPAQQFSTIQNLTAAGDELFFAADGGTGQGIELWKSDGTDAGTRQIKDIDPSGNGLNGPSLAAVGNILYFTGDDGTHDTALWRSDGTADGTTMVKDTRAADPTGFAPRRLYGYQGVLYFLSGDRVWASDGTAAGTQPATGPSFLFDELNNLDTTDFVGSGGSVYFGGNDGVNGQELWKVTPPVADSPQDDGNAGGSDPGTGGDPNPAPNPGPNPAPTPIPGITDGKILAALKKLTGLSLTHTQASFTQGFATSGSAQWLLQVTVPGKASAAGKVTVGTAKKTVGKAGRGKVTIKLNKRGKKLVRGKKKMKVTIQTRFKRRGSKKSLKTTVTKTVKVKR